MKFEENIDGKAIILTTQAEVNLFSAVLGRINPDVTEIAGVDMERLYEVFCKLDEIKTISYDVEKIDKIWKE